MSYTHHRTHEKYYLTVPFAEFPKRFGTQSHPSPRHMTLLPWFRCTPSAVRDLLPAVQGFCTDQTSFDITFKVPEPFGDHGELLAQLVDIGRTRVVELHSGLLAIVGAFGSLIDDTYTGHSYNPHSSIEGHKPFASGESVNVRSVLVVAKYAKGEHRINNPDKEHSAGFRLGPKPYTSIAVVVG